MFLKPLNECKECLLFQKCYNFGCNKFILGFKQGIFPWILTVQRLRIRFSLFSILWYVKKGELFPLERESSQISVRKKIIQKTLLERRNLLGQWWLSWFSSVKIFKKQISWSYHALKKFNAMYCHFFSMLNFQHNTLLRLEKQKLKLSTQKSRIVQMNFFGNKYDNLSRFQRVHLQLFSCWKMYSCTNK
jgi:hypothetical protein